MTKSQARASHLTSEQRRQVRRAQAVAILVLISALASLILPFSRAEWQPNWQTVVGLAGGIVIVVAMAMAVLQLRAGRLERGGWIMIGALLIAPFTGTLAIEGIDLVLSLILIVLFLIIAELTLPPAARGRAIVLGVGALIVAVLIDTAGLSGRISIPAFNSLLPLMALVSLILLGVLIVQRFSQYSLRAKLIIVSLAVSLIPLGAISVLFTLNTQQREIEGVNQALRAAAQETAANLDEFIRTSLNDIRVAAQAPELTTLLTSQPATPQYTTAETRVESTLRSLSRQDPILLSSYALLDKNGVDILDTYRPDIGVNKSDRIYFLEPLATGLPYVSPVLFSPTTGRPSLYLSALVRDVNGAVLGVLRVRYDAGVLQELLFHNNELAGSWSGAILLDDKNIQLANGLEPKNAFTLFGNVSAEEIASLKAQNRLPDKPAGELAVNLPDFVSGLLESDQTPVFTAEVHQNSGDTSYSGEQIAVERLTTQPWKVAFTRSRAEFLEPLTRQVRLITLGGLVVVLAIVGIAVLASQVIARPVVALTDAAQKVSRGDLAARAEVISRDEIGALAMAFNNMTTQLQDLVASLEDRVQARTAQLEASAEVGRAATSILDTAQLLHDITELISRRFGFYYVAVFTIDEKDQTAVLRAATGEAGRVLTERGHRLAITTESMVGAAILSHQARIALDVGKEAIRFANPLLPYTRSEIALPMRVGDQALGALDVQSEQAGAFDEASAAVLQSMADQIAVALLNAATFDRSEQQTRALALLNQLSRDLSTATTLEAIAQATTHAATSLLGACRLTLAQTTPNPDVLLVRELMSDSKQPLGDPTTIPLTNSLANEALQKRAWIYLPNLKEVTGAYVEVASLRAQGMASSVTLPLRISDRTLGALHIGDPQPDAYTPERITQLEQVAAQLTIALDNLQLAEQTRQTLVELDAANRRLVGQAWTDYTRGHGELAAEWRDGQWLTLKNAARTTTALRTTVTASSLYLPITVRGETIGQFDVTVPEAGRILDPDDVTFAQSLIDQVGQMLENARLLEETERLAQRERTINEINARVRQTIDLDTILQTAVKELGQTLKAARVVARVGASAAEGGGNGRGENND